MYYMKPLKSPTHIHFLTKKIMDSRKFFALWFWDFPVFYMRIMQSENFATNIHTHYRQSETAPIYAHYTRGKFRPQIYMRIAVRLESVGGWLSFGIFAFGCIMFCICGHRLKKVVFLLIGRLLKLDCKSVIGLHKLIVKMWLCKCNCMCICVCIWYWL